MITSQSTRNDRELKASHEAGNENGIQLITGTTTSPRLCPIQWC